MHLLRYYYVYISNVKRDRFWNPYNCARYRRKLGARESAVQTAVPYILLQFHRSFTSFSCGKPKRKIVQIRKFTFKNWFISNTSLELSSSLWEMTVKRHYLYYNLNDNFCNIYTLLRSVIMSRINLGFLKQKIFFSQLKEYAATGIGIKFHCSLRQIARIRKHDSEYFGGVIVRLEERSNYVITSDKRVSVLVKKTLAVIKWHKAQIVHVPALYYRVLCYPLHRHFSSSRCHIEKTSFEKRNIW